MTNTDQIDTLLRQVQELRDQVRPVSRDAEFDAMEKRMETALRQAKEAVKEKDLAVAELAKVKADVAWTMKQLRIKDLMFMRGSNMPCAEEGWLPLNRDPKDTDRIEWINAHGRIGAGDAHWLVSIPHNIALDTAELPRPYNIRHIIDLSMGPSLENERGLATAPQRPDLD
jgi:hypothetical protein